jgi:hypothetical protein
MLRALLTFGIGTWLFVQCPAAHADPAAAEALFREGRALLERGELDRACEAFEGSHALEASSGTLLNLAICRMKQGRTATAWAHFVSAERLATSQGRTEQAEEARRRKLELESRLSTLTLTAPEAPPGLEVRRDNTLVQPASFGTKVPVDPGTVVISASAPGYEPLSFEVTLSEAEEQRVTIPSLKKIAASSSAPEARATSTPVRVDREEAEPSVWPWVIGGIGGAALVTGGVFGALALSSNSEAKTQCDERTNDCPDEAVKTAERRDREALVSTVGIGVGLVGVGVAAIWALSSSSGRTESAWSYGGGVTRESAFLQVRAGF